MMTKFAIRDDDTCFFTRPEDLEQVYAPYWGRLPISLAVVPFSVPEHRGRSLSLSATPNTPAPLGDNIDLVQYLKNKVKANQVEIMLHGYSHEYRQIGGQWVGEFGWKSRIQLENEINQGRKYLEQLLETRIRVFVPPSNCLGKGGTHAVRKAGLQLSGLMGRGGDRPWSMDYPAAYARRWIWRLLKGRPYPHPLSYGGHVELVAHALTPRSTSQDLLDMLQGSQRAGAPFVLATHYWEFRDDPSMHRTLSKIVEAASNAGATFSTVSDCISS